MTYGGRAGQGDSRSYTLGYAIQPALDVVHHKHFKGGILNGQNQLLNICNLVTSDPNIESPVSIFIRSAMKTSKANISPSSSWIVSDCIGLLFMFLAFSAKDEISILALAILHSE